MRVYFGKQVAGPVQWYPTVFAFGGCLFINWMRRSLMIALPQRLVDFLTSRGIDVIGH